MYEDWKYGDCKFFVILFLIDPNLKKEKKRLQALVGNLIQPWLETMHPIGWVWVMVGNGYTYLSW